MHPKAGKSHKSEVMSMLKRIFFLSSLLLLATSSLLAQTIVLQPSRTYRPAFVDFNDYKDLVSKVENHRVQRLIDLDTFIEMSKEKDVVILDARSAYRFSQRHVKGAVNLNFSDFTQDNLSRVVPNTKTKILIYCNNNFEGDQINLATKIATLPLAGSNGRQLNIMLALNIPTYINLYGYGYRNIYELDELVDVNDPRIKFDGLAVR